MRKLLNPKGSLNRREFLQACGQVAVVTASYEAVSLVLGETTARAEGLPVHVPDEPLETLLPTPPIFEPEPLSIEKESRAEMSSKSFNAEMTAKSVSSEAERIRNQVRNAIQRRLQIRTPSAICGVRG